MRFTFAHVADLHLDTPFSGLNLEPNLAARLRDASLDAWDAIVKTCLERRPDFMVIAGDTYDGVWAGVRAQMRFISGLERLTAAGMQVFLVFGNHDPAGGEWTLAKNGWPSGVHAFGPNVESLEVSRDGEVLAVIHGVSYSRRDVSDNLALLFHRAPVQAFQVGLLHANLDGNAAHAAYAPCSLNDLNAAGLDYWALGHVHTRSIVQEHPCVVHYPGNAQGRHVNEPGARGFSMVSVNGEPGATACEIEFIPADSWRFLRLDAPADQPDVPSLCSAILQAAGRQLSHEDGRSVLARVRVFGRSALHRQLNAPGQAEELLSTLRDGSQNNDALYFESLIVNTMPALDPERLRERDDFSGELYRASLAAAAEPQSWLQEPLSALTALGATDLDLDSLRAAAPDIVREASMLALDAVLGGEA